MRVRRPPRDGEWDTDNAGQRGVSDVPAFILMFSIIVLAVATVAVGGVNQLTALSDREQINKAERGMEAAAATLDKIQQQNDPYRSFRFGLSGGNLWLNETELAVSSEELDLSGTAFEDPIAVNAIEHRFTRDADDISLAYEAGAVFRSNGGIERYSPAWRCTPPAGESENVAVVSLVNLTADESINFASDFRTDLRLDPLEVASSEQLADLDRALQVDAEYNRTTSVTEEFHGTEKLRVDVSETAYPDQWIRHLRVAAGWDRVGNTAEFTCEADRVLLRMTTIELSTPGI